MQPHHYQYDLDKQRAKEIAQQAQIARTGDDKAPRLAFVILLPVWYAVVTIARLMMNGITRFRG